VLASITVCSVEEEITQRYATAKFVVPLGMLRVSLPEVSVAAV
jgi:hypothetical protein